MVVDLKVAWHVDEDAGDDVHAEHSRHQHKKKTGIPEQRHQCARKFCNCNKSDICTVLSKKAYTQIYFFTLKPACYTDEIAERNL